MPRTILKEFFAEQKVHAQRFLSAQIHENIKHITCSITETIQTRKLNCEVFIFKS